MAGPNRAEEKLIDRAVEIVLEIARPQVSPYKYLYHNPGCAYSLQWFARWGQRYTGYLIYMMLLRIAGIAGYEAVPAMLLYRHTAPWNERRVKAYGRSFYLIKKDEMPPDLGHRYELFNEELQEALRGFQNRGARQKSGPGRRQS